MMKRELRLGYENNAEDEDEVSYCPQSLTILQTISTAGRIVKVSISDGKTQNQKIYHLCFHRLSCVNIPSDYILL